jgi:hypothetical protein
VRDVRAGLRPQGTANPLSWELLAVLSPIFAAFALVLVTACANVSNLMTCRLHRCGHSSGRLRRIQKSSNSCRSTT